MPSFGRGQSVADACKDTGIPRELREAPNSHYLPGAGEGSSDLATPYHPSGDGSSGAPDGGGRGSGPPVHRGARHQQGAWRPAGARVLRLRPTSRPVRGQSGRSGRMVVSRRRAERRLRSLGRFARKLTARTSCSAKLTRPLGRWIVQTPHQSQRPKAMSGSGYPRFRNDHAVAEIRIGVREFNCIGVSPPLDHPHADGSPIG